MDINLQAHKPAVAARTNRHNTDLVTVKISEDGANTSVTLRRESWVQLLEAIGAELYPTPAVTAVPALDWAAVNR